VPPSSGIPDGKSSCLRFQLPSMSQIVTPLPWLRRGSHLLGSDAVRSIAEIALRWLEVAASGLRAAASRAPDAAPHRLSIPTPACEGGGNLLRVCARLGDDLTKPLSMNSVSIPFLANFLGSGSAGSVAATSRRDLIADAERPKCDRIFAMSNLARTSLSESACGAAAAGAENLAALRQPVLHSAARRPHNPEHRTPVFRPGRNLLGPLSGLTCRFGFPSGHQDSPQQVNSD